MKIAVWHNLPSGGGKRALYDHVTGLISRGHSVEAWCPPTADRHYLPLGAIIPEHVVDLQAFVPRSTDRIGLTLPLQRQIEAMDAHCRACAHAIDHAGFDLVFANACMFFRATSIGRFAKTPSVIYLGEPFRWLYEALPRLWWLPEQPAVGGSRSTVSRMRSAIREVHSFRNKRFQAQEEFNNAAAFDRILVNSCFSRESVLRAYGLESDVCYLGIDTAFFFDQQLARSNTIVGLGHISREKNVRLCIEALATVPSPRPDLVWIGNGTSAAYLAEMITLARDRDVVFTPKVGVSDVELRDTLNQARAMLYAPRLEPFGLAPLEANACGTPVIAVAEGGVRETIIDGVTGMIVPSDPASMGRAIARLTQSPHLSRELGRNARLNVEKNWGMAAGIDRLERSLTAFAMKGPKAELHRNAS